MWWHIGTTQALADFAAGIQYDQLPAFSHGNQTAFVDTIGCAIGGVYTEKGRLAIKLAETLEDP
jgi:2-methylcitrate dehydratase PrpD